MRAMMKRTAAEPRSTIATRSVRGRPFRDAIVAARGLGVAERAEDLRLDEPAELTGGGRAVREVHERGATLLEGEAIVVLVHAEHPREEPRERRLVADHRDQRVARAFLQRGHHRVHVLLTQRGLDAWRHLLEGGGRDLGGGAGAGQRARQQDVGAVGDAGQSAGREAKAGAAPRGEWPLPVTDAGRSVADRGGVPDEQQLHGRPSGDPRLLAPALELRPLLEEGGPGFLPALALPLDEVLLDGLRGLGAVDGIVQILFDYHSILEISKDVLQLLGLVDESLAAPARGRARQLGRVAGALDLDADRVELVRARAPGQLVDRDAHLVEILGILARAGSWLVGPDGLHEGRHLVEDVAKAWARHGHPRRPGAGRTLPQAARSSPLRHGNVIIPLPSTPAPGDRATFSAMTTVLLLFIAVGARLPLRRAPLGKDPSHGRCRPAYP